MRERLLKEVLTSILPKNDVTRRRKWVCVWVRLLAVFQWERKGVLEAFCRVIYGVSAPRASERAASACSAAMKKESAQGSFEMIKNSNPSSPPPALPQPASQPKCAVYYIALCLFTRCSLFLILPPWRNARVSEPASAPRAEFIYCTRRVKTAARHSRAYTSAPLLNYKRLLRCAQSLMLREGGNEEVSSTSGGTQVARAPHRFNLSATCLQNVYRSKRIKKIC